MVMNINEYTIHTTVLGWTPHGGYYPGARANVGVQRCVDSCMEGAPAGGGSLSPSLAAARSWRRPIIIIMRSHSGLIIWL